jgi:hypothetical protein
MTKYSGGILKSRFQQNSLVGIWGVNRSSRDHFFRIHHAKIGLKPFFQLKRTLLSENFRVER